MFPKTYFLTTGEFISSTSVNEDKVISGSFLKKKRRLKSGDSTVDDQLTYFFFELIFKYSVRSIGLFFDDLGAMGVADSSSKISSERSRCSELPMTPTIFLNPLNTRLSDPLLVACFSFAPLSQA
jgi:hypothetical protein